MRIKIPVQLIELEENNFHIAVTSVFDDRTSGTWIIDTGASKTVFDKNLADYYTVSGEEEEFHSAGLTDQSVKSEIAVLQPMQLGKFKIAAQKVAIIDLSHINELYEKVTQIKISGLLGSDFLLQHSALIDYKRKTLTLGHQFK